ncbi:FtsB family cell division protein [Bifidobacterium panos]|nr:septum formation initiator family protein [Bifidobacterium sp. DSM 109963]
MSTRDRKATRGEEKTPPKRSINSGPIAFFVSLFIVAVGVIQLVSTLNVYAADLSHLNSLKRQEAALIAQKQELENDISRWDDTSYVAAQARDRLGFVFPGEQSVHVLNPQAVTGEEAEQQESSSGSSTQSKQLPWYSELSYSFKEADQEDDKQTDSADQQQSDTQDDKQESNQENKQ